MIYFFDNLPESKTDVGSKAYMLAMMTQKGYPVPNGLIIEEKLENDDLSKILIWWKEQNFIPLAVRSSARGEDSKENSFAGQNTTFLNIKSEQDLIKAIENCFNSSKKGPSLVYRKYMGLSDDASVMNIVIQAMINPIYAGVYFSKDPTKSEEDRPWLIEAVEGLGEDLVSGKKTPLKFTKFSDQTTVPLKEIVFWGEKIKNDFSYEVDMEWAYGPDENNHAKFYVLQSRPITTSNKRVEEIQFIHSEVEMLKKTFSENTLFDGNTFQEWTGVVSPVTLNLWQKVFAPNGAYDRALSQIGYDKLDADLKLPGNSLLQDIFGRGHLVLSKIADIYFGPIPYSYVALPSPKLIFNWKKMTMKIFFQTPFTWWKMLKVSLNISGKRSFFIKEIEEALLELKSSKQFFNLNQSFDQLETTLECVTMLKKYQEHFTTYTLKHPMMLVTLIESTTQSLRQYLKGVIPDNEVNQTLERWMSHGFKTDSFIMQEVYRKAINHSSNALSFLDHYGHRGMGELDLAHPRFGEIGIELFLNKKNDYHLPKNPSIELKSAEEEIAELKTLKKELIKEEFLVLKKMIFLREEFKMHYLKEYFLIRKILLRLGKLSGLNNNIFNLSLESIYKNKFEQEEIDFFLKRKQKLKKISLPPLFLLKDLESILTKGPNLNVSTFSAEALSPGLVYGEVRVVLDPENVDTTLWPENVILVTESTDPAWTGLFIKAKGLIVEKGGILSHSAIVAREMGLPAVGQLYQCHLLLKDGDKVWVDGNYGKVSIN